MKRVRDILVAPQLQAPTSPPPAAPAAAGEQKWDEDLFLERLETLVDQRKGEEALDFFLDQVAALATSGLHRRERLNHLRFASRTLEAHTASKHGPAKLLGKARLIGKAMAELDCVPSGTFLDFGCGRHDPLALATLAFANGFSRAIACDLEPVAIPRYSAQSMYEILLELYRWPDRYAFPGVKERLFQRRTGRINPRPFQKGDFEHGVEILNGRVDYRLAELTTLDVEDGELGLAVSFAVLEHVDQPQKIYDWLFRKARPGSGQIHYIDLGDHRAYRRDSGYNSWSFLTEENAPPNINRLRAREHIELIERSGFEIVGKERIKAEIPEETRAKLLSPWRDLPAEEIDTIGLRLKLRRPAQD